MSDMIGVPLTYEQREQAKLVMHLVFDRNDNLDLMDYSPSPADALLLARYALDCSMSAQHKLKAPNRVYLAPLEHLNILPDVLVTDLEKLRIKDVEYNASWKLRGGVGAFMMLARKWDRLEPAVQKYGYDVFQAIAEDMRPEGVIDDIRDLRRYLALVEAECIRQGLVKP